MYCVIYNDEVIAYHHDENVIEEYCELLINSHHEMKDKLLIGKIKTKKIPKNQLEDLYLEVKGDTYVPYKYSLYYDILTDDYYEMKSTKDNLQRLLNTEITKKERKAVEKVINILERKYGDEEEIYTPSPKELKRVENEYQYYLQK